MNPLFEREWRGRWRDKRSFGLLFVLSLGLIYLVLTSYAQAQNEWAFISDSSDISARASAMGRSIFQTLALANVVTWIFVAPLLSATPIARERESGLLESLQLSRLSMRSQIAARMAGQVLFLVLLQSLTLPVYAISFSLGGVSPGEIAGVSLCILLMAIWGVGVGTSASSRAYRPLDALFGALVLSIVAAWGSVASAQDFSWGGTASWFGLMALWHPLCGVGMLTGLFRGISVLFVESLPSTLSIHVFFLLFFWLHSAKTAAKPLPLASWQGRNPLVERWKTHLQSQKMKRDSHQKIAGALVADLPIEKLIRFQNPVLKREVKARFRWRRGTLWVSLARGIGLLIAAVGWVMGALYLLDPMIDDDVAQFLPLALWGGGTVFVGFYAALSFTKERESGTWEGLQLSLLTPTEILGAKWLAPLVAIGYLGLPLWILLVLSLNVLGFEAFFGTVLVLGASFALVCSLGLYFSQRLRATLAATCWTFGTLVILWGALPFGAESLEVGRHWRDFSYLVQGRSTGYGESYYGQDFTQYSPPLLISSLNEPRSIYARNRGAVWGESYPEREKTLNTAFIFVLVSLGLSAGLWRRTRKNLSAENGVTAL